MPLAGELALAWRLRALDGGAEQEQGRLGKAETFGVGVINVIALFVELVKGGSARDVVLFAMGAPPFVRIRMVSF